MTPLRERVMRALAMVLVAVALTANVAAADDGGPHLDYVPYDPGLPAMPFDPGFPAVPYDPGLVSVPYDPGLLSVPYDPGLPSIDEQLPSHTGRVPATSTDRRQRIEIDRKPFLFQHGYRFGKVTYVTRLPLEKSMTVFAPGHLSASEVESVVRGDNPWMLD